MVPHHEAAIEMAQAAQREGLHEPDLVRVAEAIVATQQQEIDDMRAWRADWFGSAEIAPEGAAALGLSAAEMGMGHDVGALADSADPDADFAATMVDHHAGAITMAQLALERSEREEVRELARAIIEAQSREIAVLKRHAGMHHGG
jgi:uncharacterized protein (DUF305 family)